MKSFAPSKNVSEAKTYLGIGVSTYVEICAMDRLLEYGKVEVGAHGK